MSVPAIKSLLSKATAAVFLYPLKLFDVLTPAATEKDRIPGGYYCVARKRDGHVDGCRT